MRQRRSGQPSMVLMVMRQRPKHGGGANAAAACADVEAGGTGRDVDAAAMRQLRLMPRLCECVNEQMGNDVIDVLNDTSRSLGQRRGVHKV
mmetsp:Transcript_2219/g.4983  ORF Transcript_2219/g.4983 Transcript_2219/m.4983 type:complete len:91 (-) Transcript_2219:258-530(-)